MDAPNHWVSGKDDKDISQVPLRTLVAPAVVLDAADRVAANPDFLLQKDDVLAWIDEHGPLPEGGWLLYRTGWDTRSDDQDQFLNADESGSHTPGVSAECARWLAEQTPIAGLGVETVGTDAGGAPALDPPFPCHHFLLGAGKFGLTQLQNLAALPVTGAVLVVSPLPIVGGSGSPARVLALVEREG
jgi:kynurenine formamidase